MSNRTFDWFRIVVLLLAVIGLGLCVLLVRMSTGQQVPDVVNLVCGGPASCDKALHGNFASLAVFPPRPVPTATLGMAYFTFLGLWLLLVGRLPGRLHRAWLVPSLLGLIGLAASGFFVYAMAYLIHAWCYVCLAAHATNVLLVLGIWILWLQGGSVEEPVVPALPEEPVAGAAGQIWKVPAMAVVIGLAVGLAQVRDAQTADAMKTLEAESNQLDQVYYMNARHVDIPVDADDPILGPANAPHTVVIFSDLQCPVCSKLSPILEQVQKDLAIERAARAGKVAPLGQELDYAPFRIVFKHFPLNKTCNPYWQPLIRMEDHKYACEAAAAAEAARQLGGNEAFWKMHDLIYAHHDQLASEPYKALAEQIGLNGEAFEKAWKAPATLERIQRDMREGQRAGVQSTPSVFLDGRRVERIVKSDVLPAMQMQKTVQMWQHLLQYAQLLKVKAGSSQQASGSRQAGLSAADMREQLRRSRAAAIKSGHAASASQPAMGGACAANASQPSATNLGAER